MSTEFIKNRRNRHIERCLNIKYCVVEQHCIAQTSFLCLSAVNVFRNQYEILEKVSNAIYASSSENMTKALYWIILNLLLFHI